MVLGFQRRVLGTLPLKKFTLSPNLLCARACVERGACACVRVYARVVVVVVVRLRVYACVCMCTCVCVRARVCV